MKKAETSEAALRKQLVDLLDGGQAHLRTAEVFQGVKDGDWTRLAPGAPHTLWQLLEHTRIALEDLLRFSTDPDYEEMKWPEDYWPKDGNKPDEAAVRQSIQAVEQALQAMSSLVADEATDLTAKIPWGDGQTILREALLAADHNSYHTGQAMFLRKLLESSAPASAS